MGEHEGFRENDEFLDRSRRSAVASSSAEIRRNFAGLRNAVPGKIREKVRVARRWWRCTRRYSEHVWRNFDFDSCRK
jgi:hypothetical protein